MIKGIMFSMVAGIMIALQGIFNARLGEKIGFWHTNAFVHGTGFLLAFIILLFNEKLNFAPLKEVNFYYLIGGVLGVIIIFSVIKGFTNLGASYSVIILIATQIAATSVINHFGFFGENVIPFSGIKILGLLMMVGGILIYQLS